jgi:hypothetical protein
MNGDSWKKMEDLYLAIQMGANTDLEDVELIKWNKLKHISFFSDLIHMTIHHHQRNFFFLRQLQY